MTEWPNGWPCSGAASGVEVHRRHNSQRKNPVPGGAGYRDTPRANSVNTAAQGQDHHPWPRSGSNA